MRISSLKYFYEVAELKSISKVSNNLHISQPALSHQLSKIEKELGVKLFERSNRGVELTDKGQVLYNYAKQILFLHNNLLDELDEESFIKQEIKINISSTCANFVMESVAKDLGRIFKNINVNINNNRESNDKALLLHGRSDVILGCNYIDDSDLICNKIGTDRLILVCDEYVECHDRKNLSIAILGDSFNLAVENIEKLNQANICLRTDSLDVIKSYLKNDNVGAIVPRIAVEKELKSGKLVTLCAVAYSTEYDLYMTYRKDMDANLKKKVKVLKSEIEKVLKTDNIETE